MTPKELAQKHWEERREDVDRFIETVEKIVLMDGSCWGVDCIVDMCPSNFGTVLGCSLSKRNEMEEYLTELKRLKGESMFKLGDKVEVSDDKKNWLKRIFLLDLSENREYNIERPIVVLVRYDGCDYTQLWRYVRPLNTKKQKALENIAKAREELKKAEDELNACE